VAGSTTGTFAKNVALGGSDAFLAKLSSSGHLLWVRQFGTDGEDTVRGVAVSRDGQVYVTGFTSGAFDPFVNAGSTDGFLTRFTSGGTQKWTTQLGTTEHDELTGVTVSRNGEVFLSGETQGSYPTFVNQGDVDAVATEYDKDGVQQWLQQFGTTSFDHLQGVAVSKDGNLFAGGYTGGDLSIVNVGGADAFAVQMDTVTGALAWTRQFGTTEDESVAGVSVSKDGGVILGGSTYGSFLSFANAGGSDGFAAILDVTGTQLFFAQFGTASDETAAGVATAKRSGDPIVAGGTKGSFPGFVNAGNADIYAMDIASELFETL